MRGVWVSENLQKLVGVVVMAVLVVVGVVGCGVVLFVVVAFCWNSGTISRSRCC